MRCGSSGWWNSEVGPMLTLFPLFPKRLESDLVHFGEKLRLVRCFLFGHLEGVKAARFLRLTTY